MTIIQKIFKLENDGREINGVVTLPEGNGSYPLVVMNHGFGGSKEEGIGFIAISEGLAENDIASVRFDFSGCGASVVPFTEFSLKNNISDSNAVREFIINTEAIDKNRLGILGYSMGGRLAVMVTDSDTNPYKAMTLIAPGAQDDMDFKMIPGFIVEDGKATINFFGNTFHLGTEFLEEGPATNEIMKNISKKIDSITFSGTEDVLVTPEACEIIAKKLDSTLFVLEGADHSYGFFEDQSMDYVNKIVKETVSFFANRL